MISTIQEKQGWTDETMLELLERFIAANGLQDELVDYLENLAAEENADAEDPDDDETVFATEPDKCRTCYSSEKMAPARADVNGRMFDGWICNGCGDFHVRG